MTDTTIVTLAHFGLMLLATLPILAVVYVIEGREQE